MSGVVFHLPVDVLTAAVLVEQLKPLLENLDTTVSSRVTREDLDEAKLPPVYGGKLK